MPSEVLNSKVRWKGEGGDIGVFYDTYPEITRRVCGKELNSK
jgi:hypothetical protein